jgi:hypothetical protein
MSSLDTEVMSKLAASLEGAIGVALRHCQQLLVPSMSCSTYTIISLLLKLVLVSYMAALGTKLLGEFRALGESTIGVTIGVRVLRCAVSLVWG